YHSLFSFFFLLLPPPPRPTLFPYTTLFRSSSCASKKMGSRSGPDSRCGHPIFCEMVFRSQMLRGDLSHDPAPPYQDLEAAPCGRSEEHTSELQSLAYLVCRLLLEKKKKIKN